MLWQTTTALSVRCQNVLVTARLKLWHKQSSHCQSNYLIAATILAELSAAIADAFNGSSCQSRRASPCTATLTRWPSDTETRTLFLRLLYISQMASWDLVDDTKKPSIMSSDFKDSYSTVSKDTISLAIDVVCASVHSFHLARSLLYGWPWKFPVYW